MSTVYVIGAGASHGETLRELPSRPPVAPALHPHQPPVTNGFFDGDLLDALAYPEAEQDYAELINHIRGSLLLTDEFGAGAWKTLNLEEIFTSLEIAREFENPESDEAARLLLLRNQLVRYIRRILGYCSQDTYGEHCHALVSRLGDDDSVLTFNWDLLLDLEFLQTRMVDPHYSRFLLGVTPTDIKEHVILRHGPGNGLFLKLHGSLNWFRCGNRKCEAHAYVNFATDTQACLSGAQGIGQVVCAHCGSEMSPIVVPPLLRKPITDDAVIRSAWGLARARLAAASRLVVVGFSASPTDFYTSWLLRSTVGTREGVEVIIINPSNRQGDDGHDQFVRRMNSIFLRGYDSSRHTFSQIAGLL